MDYTSNEFDGLALKFIDVRIGSSQYPVFLLSSHVSVTVNVRCNIYLLIESDILV